MSKIGRNDPCHCGSGKKYKKCCLDKDAENASKNLYVPIKEAYERNNAFPDNAENKSDWENSPEKSYYDDFNGDSEEDSEEDFDDEFIDSEHEKISIHKQIIEDSPPMNKEQEALVNAWYEEYKKIDNSPDKLLAHLEQFVIQYPNLVENLELHDEVLFEMGSDFVKAGRKKEYIDFLIKFRVEFLSSYLKSFAYYDNDIIEYLIETDQKNEISQYLNLYMEYPDSFIDNFYELYEILMGNDCQEILIDFMPRMWQLTCSHPDELFDGTIKSDRMMFLLSIPYLDSNQSEADDKNLHDRFLEYALDAPFDFNEIIDGLTNIISLKTDFIFKKCTDRDEFILQYYSLTEGFIGYLKRTYDVDWTTCFYLRECIYDFLYGRMPNNKIPKAGQELRFTKGEIDKFTAMSSQKMFYPDFYRMQSYLNAIYYFSEYILKLNLVEREKSELYQTWCIELNEVISKPIIQTNAPLTYRPFPWLKKKLVEENTGSVPPDKMVQPL